MTTAIATATMPEDSTPTPLPSSSATTHPISTDDSEADAGEARTLSPRRNSEDLEALSRDAREDLQKHAKTLQDGLLTIFHRIEAVKEEHDKLRNNNKFLQKYIGDLMSTSKITASGGGGSSSSGRGKK